MEEFEASIAGRSVMVCEDGDPTGAVLVYFHGTPGSRLDVGFGEDLATELGSRVVSFDRPGFGRSDSSPFGLTRIAEDAEAIADLLGLERLAVFGWSRGGTFALAASVVVDERVIRVGVASGPAPFQQMPTALELLADDDRLALSFLPIDPARSAEAFRAGSEEMIAAVGEENAFMSGVDALFPECDADVLADPRLRRHIS